MKLLFGNHDYSFQTQNLQQGLKAKVSGPYWHDALGQESQFEASLDQADVFVSRYTGHSGTEAQVTLSPWTALPDGRLEKEFKARVVFDPKQTLAAAGFESGQSTDKIPFNIHNIMPLMESAATVRADLKTHIGEPESVYD